MIPYICAIFKVHSEPNTPHLPTTHAAPWDAHRSAIIDDFTILHDTIDELKRLMLTGSVEVPHE